MSPIITDACDRGKAGVHNDDGWSAQYWGAWRPRAPGGKCGSMRDRFAQPFSWFLTHQGSGIMRELSQGQNMAYL